MSLISSLYIGQSGLETSQDDLSVIGDNISNANTVGFKESRGNFEDAMAQSVIGIGGQGQIGMGSQLENVQNIMQQGSITDTGNATDLALNGNGFFVVQGSYNGLTQNYYTRAGQFTLDDSGYLVNPNGLKVQGYTADATGKLGDTVGALDVGKSTTPALATTTLTLQANLNSGQAVSATAFDGTSATTAAATSDFSTSETIYDSLGASHDVQVYFKKTATGWDYHALADGGGITGGTAGVPQEIAGGSLTFGTDGTLTANTPNAADSFTPLGATSPQALTLNFGTGTAGGGTGLDGVTQFAAAASTVTNVSQDGYAAGVLSSEAVDQNGVITGTFDNGSTRTLGQVAVASFAADDQLNRAGGNLYAQTTASGDAAIGTASSGGRGAVQAGALEQSNVDLSNEFVNMIAAQEDYQADSKTITTANDCLQVLMQLKQS